MSNQFNHFSYVSSIGYLLTDLECALSVLGGLIYVKTICKFCEKIAIMSYRGDVLKNTYASVLKIVIYTGLAFVTITIATIIATKVRSDHYSNEYRCNFQGNLNMSTFKNINA